MSATREPREPASLGVQTRISNIREWEGISAETAEYHHPVARLSVRDLTSPRYRLGVVLEHVDGKCEARSEPRISRGYPSAGRPFATLTSPGIPHWAHSTDVRSARSVSISFDIPTFVARTTAEFGDVRHLSTRFNFESNRICMLGGLLASECRSPGPYGDIYGESLITAILIELLRLGGPRFPEGRVHRLAPRQLRMAMEYMEAQTVGRMTLHDLAGIAGLSPSYFARAFKATTGLPPYQWYLNVRIRRAQQMLLDSSASIAQVAMATGFADQAHFTRAFCRRVGTTPAAWQRSRLR
jgi:AraC-like DNA-binding protein